MRVYKSFVRISYPRSVLLDTRSKSFMCLPTHPYAHPETPGLAPQAWWNRYREFIWRLVECYLLVRKAQHLWIFLTGNSMHCNLHRRPFLHSPHQEPCGALHLPQQVFDDGTLPAAQKECSPVSNPLPFVMPGSMLLPYPLTRSHSEIKPSLKSPSPL